MIECLQGEIKKLKNPERAKHSLRFFKTGKGEYGEGDVFYGLTNPVCRSLSKKYKEMSFGEAETLLHSKIHEERLIALLILVEQFKKGDSKIKKQIYDLYLKNTRYINNWDLVDLSAHKIVGEYLLGKNIDILVKLAESNDLWKKRIAIISTFAFIGKEDFKPTLNIAEILLKDKHDLIHKAVGWGLREVGKRVSEKEETKFLEKHAEYMPRTMLRYAIERFDEKKRRKFLQIKQRTI